MTTNRLITPATLSHLHAKFNLSLVCNGLKIQIMLAVCDFISDKDFCQCRLGQAWYQLVDHLFSLASTVKTHELAVPIFNECEKTRKTQKQIAGASAVSTR